MSPRSFASRVSGLFWGIWASIWIFVLPKDIWGTLRLWPTVCLAVASYLWEPSSRGTWLIFLAVLWDLTMQFWLLTSTIGRPQNDLLATLVRLQDCTYTPIGWERIVRDDDVARIEGSSMVEFLRRRGLSSSGHEKHARFFLVGMGESGGIPNGLGVFNMPFMEAVILLRDDPRDAELEDRFCLYHELGHTLGDEFIVQAGVKQGVKHPFCAIVLAALAIHVTTASVLVLAASLVGVWLIHLLFVRRRKTQRAIFEMKADETAIAFLNEDEKQYVSRNLEQVLPEDSEMSPLENVARINAARWFIETGVPLSKRDPAASRLPYFGETQLLALNLCAWMVLLAGFVGAPSARLVHGFQWLIGAAFGVAILRYAIHYWKGMLLEFILIERVTWQDGRFRFRPGPSRAPSPLA